MFDSGENQASESGGEHRDVKVISVGRGQVEKGDISAALEGLDELVASHNRGIDLETKVLFRFPEYDCEDRYLHEISEVRKWFLKLETRYPFLLCLLSNLNRQLLEYVMMFVPYDLEGTVIRFDRDGLLRFLKPRLTQAASYGGAVGMEKGAVKLRVLRSLGIRECLDDFL